MLRFMKLESGVTPSTEISCEVSSPLEAIRIKCVTDGPLCLSLPHVMEQDIRLYGLKWHNNSCSFDTILTVLLYIFHILSKDEKRKFVSSWGLFGEIFLGINVLSTDSVADGKSRMLPFFWRNPTFQPGTFYSLETVYEHITNLIDGDDDIVRIKYDVTKICNEVGCPGIISTRHLNTSRQLSYFESFRANDDLPDDHSVEALMSNYWDRRLDKCRTCSQPLTIFRTFDGHPSLLTVRIARMMCSIDKEILYEGVIYSIFAVGYRGGMHFIALIKLQNEIFEYDGMVQDGLLRHVGNNVELFTNIIHQTTSTEMKAMIIWYLRSPT